MAIPRHIGDERRFKQVLINLIRNSIKFTKQGHIKVIADFNIMTSTLIVQVKDTGVGIAKEDLDKLFMRFGKLKRTA